MKTTTTTIASLITTSATTANIVSVERSAKMQIGASVRSKQICNVCKKRTLRVFRCVDCKSIICLECGKYYESDNFCLYCESDIINTNYIEVYYYKNF